MKEKILEISNKLTNEEINYSEAQKQFLFLFGVSNSIRNDKFGTILKCKIGDDQCGYCKYKDLELTSTECTLCTENNSNVEYYC